MHACLGSSVIALFNGNTDDKYRASESIAVILPLFPEKELCSDAKMINLLRERLLFISAGYSSDGPSGPTIDTKSFMLGAFVHDALYEMLR